MIRAVTRSIDVTGPAPLETAPAPLEMRPRLGLSLFWRTFFLLSLLLIGSIVAWLQTFRALEFEPRAVARAFDALGQQEAQRRLRQRIDVLGRQLAVAHHHR